MAVALASATYSPFVRVTDPVTGNAIPLNLATILVGTHGRWHEGMKQQVWHSARLLDIPYDHADTGGERPGAVAMIRRRRLAGLTEMVEQQARQPSTIELEEEIRAGLKDLANFDSSTLRPRMPYQQKHSLFHVPAELSSFFQPTRGELYHHIYSGLQQETLAHSQKNESYVIPNVSLTLFATTTLDILKILFPDSNIYLKHMARFNFVYTEQRPKWIFDRLQLENAKEALHAFRNRLSRPTIPSTIVLSPEALKYLIDHDNHKGIGGLNRQTEAYQANRSTHLIRMAGLTMLMRDPMDSEVSIEDIKIGDLLLSGSEERLQYVYLNSSLGMSGRVLAIVGEASKYFESMRQPLNYELAIGWCVASGMNGDQVKRILDQLIESRLLYTKESGGLTPTISDSENFIGLLMRRLGIGGKLKAFKEQ